MSFETVTGGKGVGAEGAVPDFGEQLKTKLINAKKKKFMRLRLFILNYWMPLQY
jgi:hypothetical protein